MGKTETKIESKCPVCNHTGDFEVFNMVGEGTISFSVGEEPVVKDFTPSHVSVSCPKCGYTVEGNIYEVRDKLLTH